jgi:hypothetical protein
MSTCVKEFDTLKGSTRMKIELDENVLKFSKWIKLTKLDG